MDCCKTENEEGCCKDLKNKGGMNMDKRITLWIVIGVLFIVALFLSFNAGLGAETVQAAGSVAQSAASYGGMVGGC